MAAIKETPEDIEGFEGKIIEKIIIEPDFSTTIHFTDNSTIEISGFMVHIAYLDVNKKK